MYLAFPFSKGSLAELATSLTVGGALTLKSNLNTLNPYFDKAPLVVHRNVLHSGRLLSFSKTLDAFTDDNTASDYKSTILLVSKLQVRRFFGIDF